MSARRNLGIRDPHPEHTELEVSEDRIRVSGPSTLAYVCVVGIVALAIVVVAFAFAFAP